MIIEDARAKINFFLKVRGGRPDGYHDIDTIFQTLKMGDRLAFVKKPGGIKLTCTGLSFVPEKENLAWRAADLLQKHYGVTEGVHIFLRKTLPVAAGLGGGSSDAAAVLRGLVRLWRLPVEPEILYELAARLGSDVPFFLEGGTQRGLDRGQVLKKLPPCPHYYVVLANPGFSVPTAAVYRALKKEEKGTGPGADELLGALYQRDEKKLCQTLFNALEQPAFRLFPAIYTLKEKMSRFGPTMMSGSGATVFTLFSKKSEAMHLLGVLHGEKTAAWITETWQAKDRSVF